MYCLVIDYHTKAYRFSNDQCIVYTSGCADDSEEIIFRTNLNEIIHIFSKYHIDSYIEICKDDTLITKEYFVHEFQNLMQEINSRHIDADDTDTDNDTDASSGTSDSDDSVGSIEMSDEQKKEFVRLRNDYEIKKKEWLKTHVMKIYEYSEISKDEFHGLLKNRKKEHDHGHDCYILNSVFNALNRFIDRKYLN